MGQSEGDLDNPESEPISVSREQNQTVEPKGDENQNQDVEKKEKLPGILKSIQNGNKVGQEDKSDANGGNENKEQSDTNMNSALTIFGSKAVNKSDCKL